jgi:hypothetical protein
MAVSEMAENGEGFVQEGKKGSVGRSRSHP